MVYDTLMREIKDSPDYIIEQALSYVRFLKANDSHNVVAPTATSSRKHPKRVFGTMKGKIKMADGFDEIPDCFKEYM